MIDEVVNNSHELWKKVRKIVQKDLSEQTYLAWIEPVSLYSFEHDIVTLEVPDSFFGTWLQERYHDLITSSFAVLLGKKPTIEYRIAEEKNKAVLEKNLVGTIASDKNIADNKQTTNVSAQNMKNAKYTFDTFVVGGSCQFAHAAAYAVSEAPAKKYNPLFIYGQVGLGKTHLLQAISYEAQKFNKNIKTLYLSSEKFTNLLISAIQNRSTVAFRQKFRHVGILLIDDIHFIAGKEATQEEFFHTFNDLYDAQKQIVLTSDRPPKDIPGLEDRLVSRFEWGLVTDIQPPDFETRVAILKKKMERETVVVPDDVAFFIASKIKTNIRELEGALIRVVAYSSLIGYPITLDLAKNVLKDTFTEEENNVTIDYIQQKTANYFNLKLSDMRTKKRNKSIAYPRQIAMYLVRSLTEHSLPEIGEYFGGRDHTTVLHAISKIEALCVTDEKTKRAVENILSTVKRG
ncbi:MAG: chromosomal replication initiator protein DnaA [Candidatus Omnitrophica bacterium]|nr:chromosomal replication initiator protein DnaA [Candidatus Omnitrophota bacterium]